MLPGSSQNTSHTPTTSSIKKTAVRHDAQPAELNSPVKRAVHPPPLAFLSAFLALAVSGFFSADFSSAMIRESLLRFRSASVALFYLGGRGVETAFCCLS